MRFSLGPVFYPLCGAFPAALLPVALLVGVASPLLGRFGSVHVAALSALWSVRLIGVDGFGGRVVMWKPLAGWASLGPPHVPDPSLRTGISHSHEVQVRQQVMLEVP